MNKKVLMVNILHWPKVQSNKLKMQYGFSCPASAIYRIYRIYPLLKKLFLHLSRINRCAHSINKKAANYFIFADDLFTNKTIAVNRIDRLMGILTVLQSKKFVQAEKIAEKFSISIRTVYRDVKALTEIGVPVSF